MVLARQQWRAWLLLAFALHAAPAWAQLQLARVEGVFLDVERRPIAAAAIHLTDPLGGTLDSKTSDDTGRFVFPGVAPGRYALRASAPGHDSLTYPVTIDAALPLDITLRLRPRITGTVVVEAPRMRDSVTSRASVAGTSVDLVPVRIGARGIQDVLATLPGWATEDNGLLHSVASMMASSMSSMESRCTSGSINCPGSARIWRRLTA